MLAKIKALWAKKMVRILVIAMVAILGFIIISSISRSCNEKWNRRVGEIQGRYDALSEKAAKERAEAEALEVERQEEIEQLESDKREKNQAIVDLKAQIDNIEPVPIITAPELGGDWEAVALQNAQAAEEWKDKYLKADEILAKLGMPVFRGFHPGTNVPLFSYPEGTVTWSLNQVIIREREGKFSYKKQLDDTLILLDVAHDLNVTKDKTISRLKFKFTLKNVGYSALAFLGGYFIGDKT